MLISFPYDRDHANAYARRWALSRNPLFPNYTGIGGDCTNFVSQCVYAGCCVMNYTPTFGWYYLSPTDRAPAWTGVEYFCNFMTGNDGVGPYMTETYPGGLSVGDVIQLGNTAGDYYHTLFVTGFAGGTYLVAAHSDDALDRPLDSYRYAGARFLHVEGIRTDVPEAVYETYLQQNNCFPYLYDGGGESTQNL